MKGPDGLETLLRSLLAFAAASPPRGAGNAERKYLQLQRFCDSGPVVLWLVAAGARWAFLAVQDADRLALAPIAGVCRADVYQLTKAV